mmetsp:Transcript_34006/g.74156  ORF Transcript_34006/g.74156 Transcript_34006/m.74156 type:complete len:240 (-) Transcript_34006:70-789(-)|eukprot:CAMPEP_0116946324 /NCGR_PEP_ID=MMETSP0467-20121206/36907_1 /TAXON_ID=283647 /ORGANISM="Mesodinium pulex, Strain SPMC105" /LENGTH=239 /DNA_ID=CAMNT_0004630059 /DNA_START=35 /DNA_END=754 /DNA_ORIENTATION=-
MSAVPESFKKKSARQAELAAKAAADAAKAAKDAVAFNSDIAARAEAYDAEYAKADADAIANRRQAKANNQIFVAPEAKIAFVIRIRGIIGVSPKVKKILQLLRLRQINNAVFVRLNAATIKMLRMVEPYIAYGTPNMKSVRELIYKRGYGKVSGQRVPLSSNTVVNAALGNVNIVCVEDVIHEIFTAGEHFKEASNFLWPFKLNSPRKGFQGKKLNHYNEGGSYGYQGDQINRLIKKMI